MASQVCADCRLQSPEADTNYTLIGIGWRLRRFHDAGGAVAMHWLCPACWRAFKETQVTPSAPPAADGSPAEAFARAGRRLRGPRHSDPPAGD